MNGMAFDVVCVIVALLLPTVVAIQHVVAKNERKDWARAAILAAVCWAWFALSITTLLVKPYLGVVFIATAIILLSRRKP